MRTVTQDEYNAGLGFIDGEVLKVITNSGHSFTVVWDASPYDPIVDEKQYPAISVQKFRERFDIFSRTRIDRLENNMENDAIVLQLCPNLTPDTLEPNRSFLRTIMKTLYHTENNMVHLDSVDTIDGMNLLLSVGIIDQITYDSVLDLTTI